MASDNSMSNPQNRNVPIHSEVIVPKEELVHTSILSKRISKNKIEELEIQKYRACGQGVDFSDVMEFRCSKANAQRILKDCCGQRILFRSPKGTSPQRYYPSIIKADIPARPAALGRHLRRPWRTNLTKNSILVKQDTHV